MQYLCLAYQDEAQLEALSAGAYAAIESEICEYAEELRQSGHAIATAPLQPAQSATTIRIRNGALSICDGPFAETREQLSGFYLIEARDLNDAIRVAARMPLARLGCVEVRPIKVLKETK
jgi:hypothetical protein